MATYTSDTTTVAAPAGMYYCVDAATRLAELAHHRDVFSYAHPVAALRLPVLANQSCDGLWEPSGFLRQGLSWNDCVVRATTQTA